jgi:hypothetical protein
MSTGGGANSRCETGLAVAASFNTDGSFAALYGFEMTWSNRAYGHINTFNTTGYVSTNNPSYNAAGGVGLRAYYNLLAQHPTSVSMFNHPGTTFGDFSHFAYRTAAADHAISLIEVGNGEGTNQQLNKGYWRSDKYYDNALAQGWHLAPVNSQDNHAANWGMANKHRTVALATELSRESIYEALSNRRAYSTEDDNFRMDYTINGMPMGTIFNETPVELAFSIRLADLDESVGMVHLVTKNGVVVASRHIDSRDHTWEFTLPPEHEFYYVRVIQDDGDMILSAPIWLREVKVESMPMVVVDASHKNAYVNGDYANNMNTLGASAMSNGIQLKQADVLDEAVLHGAKGLVLTVPQRTLENVFGADALAAIAAYAQTGGNFIVAGRADYGDPANAAQTSLMMNSVLAAIGATTRINDDEVVLNNNSTFQFVTNAYNRSHPLLRNLELNKGMRFYSGASLIVDAGKIADGTVLSVLNCLEGCYSFDSDKQGDATPVESGAGMYLLVSERLPGGGTAYVAGSAFLSDFERNHDNPVIAEAMLKSMAAAEQLTTPIAQIHGEEPATEPSIEPGTRQGEELAMEPGGTKKSGCSSASGAPLAMLAIVFWGLARRHRANLTEQMPKR